MFSLCLLANLGLSSNFVFSAQNKKLKQYKVCFIKIKEFVGFVVHPCIVICTFVLISPFSSSLWRRRARDGWRQKSHQLKMIYQIVLLPMDTNGIPKISKSHTSEAVSCFLSLIWSCLHFSRFLWCITIRLRMIAYSTRDRNTSNMQANNHT